MRVGDWVIIIQISTEKKAFINFREFPFWINDCRASELKANESWYIEVLSEIMKF